MRIASQISCFTYYLYNLITQYVTLGKCIRGLSFNYKVKVEINEYIIDINEYAISNNKCRRTYKYYYINIHEYIIYIRRGIHF